MRRSPAASHGLRRPRNAHRAVITLLLVGLLVLPVTLVLHGLRGENVRIARAQAAGVPAQDYVISWPCDTGGAALEPDFAEQRMVEAVNRYRAGLGLPELAISMTLQRTARWKAASLAAEGPTAVAAGLSHDDPGGRTWDQRFLDCGYPAAASFAENLAAGNERIEDVVDAWRGSPAHARNLSDSAMRYTGVARARAGSLDGVSVYVWVLEFGSEP